MANTQYLALSTGSRHKDLRTYPSQNFEDLPDANENATTL